jgi:endonuclease YncB( thermonuclease family)
MARIVKPDFGSRHHRKPPDWHLGGPPRSWRRRVDWPLVSLVAIVFVTGFVWLLPALEERTGARHDVPDVRSRNAASDSIAVVDGDTVRSGGRTYRLVGFNTPEAGWHAHCAKERALASKATHRLQELVDRSDVRLSRVACSCPPGTEGTDACNYGRLCGRLRANGRDVGATLIAEGLAERYACGATSCPPRKNWCAG